MKKHVLSTLIIGALSLSVQASEKQKLSLMLDWFVNPDHAALIVAQQKGFFAEHNLEVDIIEPADPSLPPKLVAAGKTDLAIDYQPQLHIQVDEKLPLVRIATLANSPLNSLVTLENSGIKTLADLKGKKIGYSVSGFETALLDAMLNSANLSNKDVQLINVNWSLSPSLISKQVDAVIGSFRNFELNQLAIEGYQGKAFFPEQYGVPTYDELIIVANKDKIHEAKYQDFVSALQQATDYLNAHPEESWQLFVSYKPAELDNELNRRAWKDTLPYLSKQPGSFNKANYEKMADFMLQQGLLKSKTAVEHYATELKK